MSKIIPGLLAAFILMWASPAWCAEGFYLAEQPPLETLQKEFGFSPDIQLQHAVQSATLQINHGGTGVFVSPDGLILTNHHVALSLIQQLSSPERDLMTDGYAGFEELKTDATARVLLEMTDVTDQVMAGVLPEMSPSDAERARLTRRSEIEKAHEQSGVHCEVIPFFQDSIYFLMKYKEYTDIRLVCAPEYAVAFFGEEHDNFTYPRFNLDFTLLRAYEGGKPVHSPGYLSPAANGYKEKQPAFVCGFPGETHRAETVSQLTFIRNVLLPMEIRFQQGKLDVLKAYAKTGTEQARQAKMPLFYIGNSLKSMAGGLTGLDSELLRRQEKRERALKYQVLASPESVNEYGDPWTAMEHAQIRHGALFERSLLVNLGNYTIGELAVMLVLYGSEREKPDAERLPEYRESRLDQIRHRILSSQPMHLNMEKRLLQYQLEQALTFLSPEDPFIRMTLENHDISAVVETCLEGTGLFDLEIRRALLNNGKSAVENSQDPLLVLAKRVAPIYREMEMVIEKEVHAVEAAAGITLARIRQNLSDDIVPPDANGTLRFSYGSIRGYNWGESQVPNHTTLYGLFDRAYSFGNTGAYALPERYLRRREVLHLATPLNFVLTADIAGGSSGSPVINTDGKLLGLIFDGNIQFLACGYAYTEFRARAVAVDIRAILHVLSAVYRRPDLVREITAARVTGQ